MPQLTITLDDDLLQAAQAYARQQGQEVDKLVADLLQAAVRPAEAASTLTAEERLATVRRLAGSVQLPPDFDYKKAVEEAIWEKYNSL